MATALGPPEATASGVLFYMRVTLLVDGFNLYHSVKAAERSASGKRMRWLDLWGLCDTIVRSSLGHGFQLDSVHYYSALAQHLEPRKPDVVRRHRTFLAALESTGVSVNLAKFKRKERVVTLAESRVQFQPIRRWWHLPLRSVRVSFKTHEEKETDVAIACKLLEVLHRGQCDAVVLLTGDTDIAPAIRTARALYPKQEIIVAFPFQRYNKELANLVARSVKLSVQLYEAHQFPVTVKSAKGKSIVKPKTW